jgi:hypothetical protein
MSRVGDIPKSSLSSVAPNSNGTIAVLFPISRPCKAAYEDKFAISGAHLLSVAFDYVSDVIQSQKATKLAMKAANCRIRARRHAAPNGETRPRSLVLREPRHANGLGIEDGARPGVQALVAQGWRSVSFLHGIGTSCVILIGDSASQYLQEGQGRLIF